MEKHIDEIGTFNLNSYTDVRDTHTGIWYRAWGAYPAVVNIVRMIFSIIRAVQAVGGGRVYQDSSDTATEFSVTPLSYCYRGQLVTMNAANAVAMAGGDGVYSIYAIPGSTTVQVSAVGGGWPAGSHVRLGQITLANSVWDFATGFIDSRSGMALRVMAEPVGGNLDVLPVIADAALLASQSHSIIHNSGASGQVIISLPAAAAGLVFSFAVATAQNMRVTAASGDTIRVGAGVSGAGGHADSATVGGTVTLAALDATQWVATAGNATGWTLT